MPKQAIKATMIELMTLLIAQNLLTGAIRHNAQQEYAAAFALSNYTMTEFPQLDAIIPHARLERSAAAYYIGLCDVAYEDTEILIAQNTLPTYLYHQALRNQGVLKEKCGEMCFDWQQPIDLIS